MKTLHLICNAHIDNVWQWTWNEGISAALSTFKSAADLCDEFDYIFCHNESLLYEIIKKYDKELFYRIKTLVSLKKWHIMGGWYIQPDCNMPSGEGIIRNILVGREFFKNEFNAEPKIAINFDSFGHSLGLVQIMAKCGYEGYIFCRPNKEQFDYKSDFFNWIAPDGNKIRAAFFPQYNTLLGQADSKISNYFDSLGDGEYFFLWGVGNHGGGPSRKDLADIKATINKTNSNVFHSTPEKFFDSKKSFSENITVSLNSCMCGCYSSMARVKQSYKKAESNFFAAEKIAAIATLNGMQYDSTCLKNAQKQLLLTQFHDILPGTCVKSGEQNALDLLGAVNTAANDLISESFFYLLQNEPAAKEGEYPLFVFNYLPYPIKTIISAEFQLADQNWDCGRKIPKVYFKGTEILSQEVKEDSTINLDWRKRIVFVAELEPLKLNRFSVFCNSTTLSAKGFYAYPIELDNAIKHYGKNILKSKPILRMYDDTADPWAMSNEELIELGKNPRDFTLMSEKECGEFCGINNSIAPVRIIEDGEVLTRVESLYKCENTRARIELSFYKELDYIDVNIDIEFLEKNKLVRLLIPFSEKGVFFGDGPFIIEDKFNTTKESVFQKLCGIEKENKESFVVLNNCIYSGRRVKDGIELTLLRGAGYCVHPIPNRELYPQDRYLDRIDSGRYSFSFRVLNTSKEKAMSLSEEFSLAAYSLNAFPTSNQNKIPQNIRLSDSTIVMSSFRQLENNRFALTVFNPSNTKKEVILSAFNNEYKLILASFEISMYILSNKNLVKKDCFV